MAVGEIDSSTLLAMRWLWDKILSLSRGPVFPTVVGFFATTVLFVGGLYSGDIKLAFPFYWGIGQISWMAALFWISLVASALVIAARGVVDEQARSRLLDETRQIRERSEELQLMVQTLPPRSWREVYARILTETLDALAVVRPRKDHPELDVAELGRLIRAVLQAITALALRYDGDPQIDSSRAALYAANVMLFLPRVGNPPFFSADHAAALRFVVPDLDHTGLDGMLVLKSQLSYSSATNGEDQSFGTIALPVPAVRRAPSGRWRVLPGAPMAFATQKVDGYEDSHTLGKWFDDNGDFPASIRDEVARYFQEGPGAASRSFISRPLNSGQRTLGVVNLHSDLTDILGLRHSARISPVRSAEMALGERREVFFSMITPLWEELAGAVASYVDRSSFSKRA